MHLDRCQNKTPSKKEMSSPWVTACFKAWNFVWRSEKFCVCTEGWPLHPIKVFGSLSGTLFSGIPPSFEGGYIWSRWGLERPGVLVIESLTHSGISFYLVISQIVSLLTNSSVFEVGIQTFLLLEFL